MAEDATNENGPILKTERLVLRPPHIDDVDRLAAIANDKRIARNMTSNFPHPYTVDDARSFLQAHDYAFAIEPVEPIPSLGPGMVGIIGGSDRADSSAADFQGVYVFGYWLTPDAWGRGLATEAGRAYLDHILDTRRPRRIEAAVYGWNPASGHVLEKLGFEFEGRLKDRVMRFGDVTDELMYGLATGLE